MALVPADVQIDLGPYGMTRFAVNGEDWTNSVRGLQLTADPDAVPVIEVQLVSKAMNLDGPGIVVVKPDSLGDKEAILAFLNSVEYHRLEAASLENTDYNMGPAESILNALKAMVQDG